MGTIRRVKGQIAGFLPREWLFSIIEGQKQSLAPRE